MNDKRYGILLLEKLLFYCCLFIPSDYQSTTSSDILDYSIFEVYQETTGHALQMKAG